MRSHWSPNRPATRETAKRRVAPGPRPLLSRPRSSYLKQTPQSTGVRGTCGGPGLRAHFSGRLGPGSMAAFLPRLLRGQRQRVPSFPGVPLHRRAQNRQPTPRPGLREAARVPPQAGTGPHPGRLRGTEVGRGQAPGSRREAPPPAALRPTGARVCGLGPGATPGRALHPGSCCRFLPRKTQGKKLQKGERIDPLDHHESFLHEMGKNLIWDNFMPGTSVLRGNIMTTCVLKATN